MSNNDFSIANEGLLGTVVGIGIIAAIVKAYFSAKKIQKNSKEVADKLKNINIKLPNIDQLFTKYENESISHTSKLMSLITSSNDEDIKTILDGESNLLNKNELYEIKMFSGCVSKGLVGAYIAFKEGKNQTSGTYWRINPINKQIYTDCGSIGALYYNEVEQEVWESAFAEMDKIIDSFNKSNNSFNFDHEHSNEMVELECYINTGLTMNDVAQIINKIEQEASKVKNGSESFLTELSSTYFENTNVQFRPDTDLGHINNALVSNLSLTMPSGLDEEEQTQVMVDHIDKYLQSEEGANYFEHIQKYSEMFSEKINDAFSTLKNKVTPEVQSLTEKIEEKRNEIVNRVTHMVDIDGAFTEKEPQFTILNLEKFRTEESINNAQYLVDKYFTNKINKVSVSTLKYIADKLNTLEDIKFSNEEMDEYTSVISETLNNDPSSDSAELKASIYQAILPVFNQYEFNKLKRLIINDGIKSGKLDENAISNAYAFSKLMPIFNNLDRIVDIDNEKVLNTFKNNIEVINDLYRLSTVLLVLANEKYENCTIIGRTMLNQSGVTKVESNGGTLQDIDKFIRLNYNDNKDDVIYSEVAHMEIPGTGISADTIIKNLEITRSKYSTLENKIKNQHKSIVNTASKQAYEEVLKSYISDIEINHSELISNTTPRQFTINGFKLISHLAYNLVRFDTNNLTDSVYEFYLKTWYPTSLVNNIYHKLGTELINTINDSGTIDEDTTKEVGYQVLR